MVVGIFPPGVFIAEELEIRGLTQDDLARITGRPASTINKIIKGKASITAEIAKDFSAAFGVSAELFLNLECAYQLALAKESDKGIERRARVYNLAPVSAMQKRGWIKKTDNIEELEAAILDFYELDTLEEIENFRMAARGSNTVSEESLSARRAWGRQVLRMAAKNETVGAFDPERMSELKSRLKELTDSLKGAEKVPALLAEYGIRFVIVEHLPRTKIDGAALWLEGGRPVIGMSLRYDRVDCFWHTLLHELSHIANNDAPVIDMDVLSGGNATPQEKRANTEAEEALLPRKLFDGFVQNEALGTRDIINFSFSMKIHPGIVVGRLQHKGNIPFSAQRVLLKKIRSHVLASAETDGWKD